MSNPGIMCTKCANWFFHGCRKPPFRDGVTSSHCRWGVVGPLSPPGECVRRKGAINFWWRSATTWRWPKRGRIVAARRPASRLFRIRVAARCDECQRTRQLVERATTRIVSNVPHTSWSDVVWRENTKMHRHVGAGWFQGGTRGKAVPIF